MLPNGTAYEILLACHASMKGDTKTPRTSNSSCGVILGVEKEGESHPIVKRGKG